MNGKNSGRLRNNDDYVSGRRGEESEKVEDLMGQFREAGLTLLKQGRKSGSRWEEAGKSGADATNKITLQMERIRAKRII